MNVQGWSRVNEADYVLVFMRNTHIEREREREREIKSERRTGRKRKIYMERENF